MATKFTKFNGSNIDKEEIKKLQMNQKPTTVISIIGESRIGKSSFLNGFISFLCNENKQIFKTKSDVDPSDCTTGIDYYIHETKKNIILFLDVQGIGGNYSENDPSVLLFIYGISDLIIYSVKQLNVSTLMTLSPIGLHAGDIEKTDRKPHFVYHVKDVNQNHTYETMNTMYETMMRERNDSVFSMRILMNQIFQYDDKCKILHTFHPSEKQLKLLDDGKYLQFMADDKPKTQYRNIFFRLNTSLLDTIKPRLNVLKSIYEAAKIIEDKQEVFNAKNFDFVGISDVLAIHIWINGTTQNDEKINSHIPEEALKEINIDYGTQDEWDALITPRIELAKKIRKEFYDKFHKFPKNIFEDGKNQLSLKIDIPVDNAMQISYERGFKIITARCAELLLLLYKCGTDSYGAIGAFCDEDAENCISRVNTHCKKIIEKAKICTVCNVAINEFIDRITAINAILVDELKSNGIKFDAKFKKTCDDIFDMLKKNRH